MITPDEVRRLALALPGVAERSHFDIADFRVRNRIIATLWPDGLHAMLKLSRDERETLVHAAPETYFVPRGATGGATAVVLARSDPDEFAELLQHAWALRARPHPASGSA